MFVFVCMWNRLSVWCMYLPKNTYTYIHLQHICILYVLYVCMYVHVCVCIWKNVLRYTDIYRQYIHIHTKCLIHTIHADTCRYTLYTQYKLSIHIHAIQVYTSNTYNTHIFIQYTEIHTIHTHTYICMYVHVCVCIGMYYLYYVGIGMNEYVYDSISVYMHVFASMCLNLCVCACICMYLLVCAWICVYVYVFVFLFCTRRKREKVAQARTWCPAMCCQKGNQMPAKLLRRFWVSNTRRQSDMCPSLPLSQLWLWHFMKFWCTYSLKSNTHTYRQYIHIRTYTYNTCNTCTYRHIHACANHGRKGSLGGCGRRCMSQGTTKLPQ